MGKLKSFISKITSPKILDNIVLSITLIIMLVTAYTVFFIKNPYAISIAICVAFITAILSTNYISPSSTDKSFFARLFDVKSKLDAFEQLTCFAMILTFLTFLVGRYTSHKLVQSIADIVFYIIVLIFYIGSIIMNAQSMKKNNTLFFILFWIIVPALIIFVFITAKYNLIYYRFGVPALIISVLFQLYFPHRFDKEE